MESTPLQWHRHAHSTAHGRHGRRNVLIVDDDRDSRETLGLLLQEAGHSVSLAASGAEALQIVAAAPPDVIFLDISMPRMDGYTVCRRVHALPGADDIRIYALSGLSGPEHERRCAEAGFSDCLLKPLEPMLLSKLV